MNAEQGMAKNAAQGYRALLWAPVLLAGLGIFVSGYLVTKRFTGGSLACTRWAQCDVVNNSLYSQIYGVPVSVIGLAGYLLVLGVALVALRTHDRTQRQLLLLNFLLSLGGVGFSAYLTYLEVYVIEALCAWCVASAVIITLLLVTNAIAVCRSSPADSRARAHA
jgi:uncharacterized membrane protein